MKTVQLRDAKATLSALVHAAERGETTILTKHGRPGGKLVPFDEGWSFGLQKGPNLIEGLRL